MTLHIGFAGNQHGMSPEQTAAVGRVLDALTQHGAISATGHHGDCIGADAEFHAMLQQRNIRVGLHPPIIADKRAYCVGDFTFAPAPDLQLSREIVDACDVVIAAPRSAVSMLCSDTGATIKYAKACSKVLVAVYPDGSMSTTWTGVWP